MKTTQKSNPNHRPTDQPDQCPNDQIEKCVKTINALPYIYAFSVHRWQNACAVSHSHFVRFIRCGPSRSDWNDRVIVINRSSVVSQRHSHTFLYDRPDTLCALIKLCSCEATQNDSTVIPSFGWFGVECLVTLDVWSRLEGIMKTTNAKEPLLSINVRQRRERERSFWIDKHNKITVSFWRRKSPKVTIQMHVMPARCSCVCLLFSNLCDANVNIQPSKLPHGNEQWSSERQRQREAKMKIDSRIPTLSTFGIYRRWHWLGFADKNWNSITKSRENSFVFLGLARPSSAICLSSE